MRWKLCLGDKSKLWSRVGLTKLHIGKFDIAECRS